MLRKTWIKTTETPVASSSSSSSSTDAQNASSASSGSAILSQLRLIFRLCLDFCDMQKRLNTTAMELVHKKNKREKDMYARVQEGKWGVDEGVDGGGEAGAAEDEDGFEASVPHLPQFIKWFIGRF